MSDYTKTVVRGTAIVLVMMVATAGMGYLFRLLLARNLSIEDFGLFFAVFSFVNLFYGFKGFGTGPAYVRFISEYRIKNEPENIKKVLLSFLVIQLVLFGFLSLIILLSSKFLTTHYFKSANAYWILILLTIAFFFSMFFSTFRGLFQGFKKMSYYSTVEFAQTLLVLLFSYLLFKFGINILSPAWAYLISFVIVAGWCFLLALKLFPLFKIKSSPEWKTYKELMLFGVPVTIAMVFSSLLSSVDVLFLTYFRSLKEVALYSVALPTANLLRYVPKALATIILPVSAELYLTHIKGFTEGIRNAYRYIFLIVTLLSLLLFSSSNELILLFFGDEFGEAAIPLRILSIGMIFSSIYLVNQWIILGVNKPRMYLWMVMVASFLSVILNLALIPFFGIIGASLAFLAVSLFLFVYSIIQVKKLAEVNLPLNCWLKTIIIGGITLLVGLWINKIISFIPIYKIMLVGLLELFLYIAGILLFKVTSISQVKEMFRK